jgi:hypothetical protein
MRCDPTDCVSRRRGGLRSAAPGRRKLVGAVRTCRQTVPPPDRTKQQREAHARNLRLSPGAPLLPSLERVLPRADPDRARFPERVGRALGASSLARGSPPHARSMVRALSSRVRERTT